MTTLPTPARSGWTFLLATYGAYALVATAAAGLGLFAGLDANWFAATAIAAALLLTAAALAAPPLRALSERLGPYGLAAFHVWRVPAALVFFAYGAQGLLPPTFVWLAGVGDLLAGAFAAALFMLPRSRRLVTAFHLFGFADFLLAFGTGITLTALGHPLMANVTALPVALIPLVGVPLSAATHLAAFRLLSRP